MKKFFGRRGQAAVEFSLLLPIFALILFATIYIGFFVLDYVTLDNAAAKAARNAALNPLNDYKIVDDDKTKIESTALFLSWYELKKNDCTKRKVTYNEDDPPKPEYVTVMIQATLKDDKDDTILKDILPDKYTISKVAEIPD